MYVTTKDVKRHL